MRTVIGGGPLAIFLGWIVVCILVGHWTDTKKILKTEPSRRLFRMNAWQSVYPKSLRGFRLQLGLIIGTSVILISFAHTDH